MSRKAKPVLDKAECVDSLSAPEDVFARRSQT